MTKSEYLNELYARLSFLPQQERMDIMHDYEEHFAAGAEKGKTEEQICSELGSPEMNARQFGGNNSYSYNQPYASRNQGASRSAYSYNQSAQNTQNRIAYLILLVLDIIFIAIPGYSLSVGLVGLALAVIITSIAAGIFTGSVLLGLFLIFVATSCLLAGILLFLLITWSLRICFRKFQS